MGGQSGLKREPRCVSHRATFSAETSQDPATLRQNRDSALEKSVLVLGGGGWAGEIAQ